MDGEVDDTGQDSSSISYMMDYVRSLIPGYTQENEDEECQEKIGDRLKKKRMRTKKKSSLSNEKDYPGVSSSRKRPVGCKRSMVRYIGSNVPMGSSQEAYYELLDNSRRAFMSSATNFLSANLDHVRQHVDQVKYHVVPTLADIGQLVWDGFDDEEEILYEEDEVNDDEDDGETNEKGNEGGKQEKDEASSNKQESQSSMNEPEESSSKAGDKTSAEGAKINQLEDELAKLRAQIAMIVSGTAPLVPPSQPAPVAVVPPIISQAPPPPPPPPPPPAPSSTNNAPLIKINKVSKEAKKEDEESAPNLSDVLKGLSSVKLKSVPNRSPGGTPMKAAKPSRAESNDPADIIARALKEKFRNSKTCYDSPESECSPSGFSPSPRKNKRSPKVVSSLARPVPRPRPKPRPKTQKKTSSRESDAEKTKLFK